MDEHFLENWTNITQNNELSLKLLWVVRFRTLKENFLKKDSRDDWKKMTQFFYNSLKEGGKVKWWEIPFEIANAKMFEN